MTKFSDLALDPRVLQGVAEAGYETPTPIQAATLPDSLAGRDVLGRGRTGSGKTYAFLLPLVARLSAEAARGTRETKETKEMKEAKVAGMEKGVKTC